VTKLQKGDFFASKLIVFSVTFGRKTKKSQPPTGASSGGISLRSQLTGSVTSRFKTTQNFN
jgi:hypothetical protein